MDTVTVKVAGDLKEKMQRIGINWSAYIRDAIRRRVELEERREAVERLLEGLKAGEPTAPKGFINETIREMRAGR